MGSACIAVAFAFSVIGKLARGALITIGTICRTHGVIHGGNSVGEEGFKAAPDGVSKVGVSTFRLAVEPAEVGMERIEYATDLIEQLIVG